jgi:formylglycine-generating enzyme required for sulfatase activity
MKMITIKLFTTSMLILLSVFFSFVTSAQSKKSLSLQAGQTFRDCPTCPEMVVIPAGSFMLGSPDSEKGRFGDSTQTPIEGPQQKINIKQFAAGKFDLTKEQWAEFVQATNRKTTASCMFAMLPRSDTIEPWRPDSSANWNHVGFKQDSSHPVVCVSWKDAQDYANWLSSKTGFPYRLFTESEWEYVDRAGTTTPYYWGDTANRKYANYGNDSVPGKGFAEGDDKWVFTSPVGSFPPNPFGLYDMNGNVYQWVEDCLSITYSNYKSDGTAYAANTILKFTEGPFSIANGKNSCDLHAVRGGSFGDTPQFIRSAARNFGALPGVIIPDLSSSAGGGFRVARTL